MNVEYELAFVGVLPKNVRVVDAHTLDFSKNPAGALAFRYRHGWILINPLIPSRGLSGGGLARQHGHISGGHTTGHFVKGADGKISFKAVNRYASKADWEAEVKKGAAGVAAKQEAAKAAVQKAERATNMVHKLEESGASKAVLAAAHKVAATQHADAAHHFQGMGKDGLKSGVLTHSAHSAIHASKATKLEQGAKEDAAKALEAEKAAAAKKLADAKAKATKLTAEANELTASIKGGNHTPKQAAELHTKAAAAHLNAQHANEEAGNKFVGEAHAGAVAKHEKIAENQQKTHDSLDKAAATMSDGAYKKSKSASIASEEGDTPLAAQAHAHNQAAQAHGQAANAHGQIGNDESVNEHKQHEAKHAEIAAGLQKQHDEHEAKQKAAQAEIAKHAKAADEAANKGHALGDSGSASTAFKDAAAKYEKAHQAAKAAGLHDEAEDHKANAASYKAKAAEVDKKNAEALAKMQAYDAHGKKAHAKTSEVHEATYAKASDDTLNAKHLEAALLHSNAEKAALDAGFQGLAADHKEAAQGHMAKATQHGEQATAAAKAESEKSQALQQAGQAFNAADDALTAGDKDKAIENYKKVAELADKADSPAMKANALSSIAEITGDHKDHQAAGQAAAKALKAEQDKDEPKDWAVNKFKNLVQHHGDAADAAATKKAAEAPSAPVKKVDAADDGKVLKPVGKLTYTGKTLGSHGSKLMKDEDGNLWLAKTDEYSRSLDPAVAALHRKVGLPTPVFVKTKDGHLQGMIPGAEDAFPGYKFNADMAAKMPPEDIMKMLQHQVLDYATGNQDSHNGQWIKSPSTGLMSIDQGQAFKYTVGASNGDPYKGDGGKSKGDPLTTYGPNAHSAVYPALWQAAKEGKIQLPDPSGDNEFAKTIKAIQDMPDEEFKRLFAPYAKQALASGHKFPGGVDTEEKFLDKIVAHKNSLGKDFQKLYDDLPDKGKQGAAPAQKAAKAADAPEAGSGGSAEKDAALKAIAEMMKIDDNDWNETDYKVAKSKALAAGATKAEITSVVKDPDAFLANSPSAPSPSAKDSGLSAKDAVIKTMAEKMASGEEWEPGEYTTLKQKAIDLGADPKEVIAAIQNPKAFLDKVSKSSAPTPAPQGLSEKEKALKALAAHEHDDNTADWNHQTSEKLENAAINAGATPDEIHAAYYKSDETLKALKAKESAAAPAEKKAPEADASAPAAPSGPKTDPFKPKAKWSKVEHGVKDADGNTHMSQGVAGPKNLVVHKALGGSGWSVTQADGMKMGSHKFKTQKEAKLAAEWMAKNYGGKNFTKEEFAKWKNENPQAFADFKQGVINKHWNTEAQAELDKQNNPATAAAAAAPSGTGSLSAKQAALKALAEHNLPQNSDHWDYDKSIDLKEAAEKAGASTLDIAQAQNSPKTYLKSQGLSPDVVTAPEVKYTGLGITKKANAVLLKKLYDQAHGPNATPAQIALYKQAKKDWDAHYSSPFDPASFDPAKAVPKGMTAAEAGDEDAVLAHTKTQFAGAHAAGYTAATNGVDIGNGWKPKGKASSAVYTYTGHEHSEINGQLRGHFDYDGTMITPPVGATGGDWDDTIKHMDDAFRQAPPLAHDLVTVRKMGTNGQFPDFPPPMDPGNVYQDLAYGSTAKDKNAFSGNVWMEVRIPKGHKVIDANYATGSKFSHEQEILLPRGTKYRVVSDQASPPDGTKPYSGKRYIVVEIVPTDEWD